jgi:N-acyl-D-aspartate/D-glutamate deacylase
MAYDLLIKNGRIIDGSGAHAFRGDVGVRDGKITGIGKLGGDAARTIDAGGLVVSPGFIDNHCHYDAQIFWDPLFSSSCYHGATSVIVGNCSLGLAPVKPEDRSTVAGMLSFVEAIPMDVLQAGVPWTWTSFPEYVAAVEQRLGLNVGILLGHSAVRYFAMGDASFEEERAATPEQLSTMRAQIWEAMEAGALGMSMTRERSHFDLKGRRVPGVCAPEDELFEVAGVLGQFGAGVIQCGGGTRAQMDSRLMSRLSDACGRRVLYNAVLQSARTPGLWKEHLAVAEDSIKAGSRAIPMATPNPIKSRFTMRNCQIFRGMPNWHPILIAPDDAKLAAYRDPEVRQRLHADLDAPLGPNPVFSRRWELISVVEAQSSKNRHLAGKTLLELGAEQHKHPLDALLDLALEEHLDTVFEMCEINFEREAMASIITSPYTLLGLSDGGAHVQFDSGVGYTTRLLGYWVREQKIMTLEAAVRALTLVPALAFEIYDRGLLRPGMVADITVFDPDTVEPLPSEIAHDFPNNGWRIRQRARGIEYTVVNGVVVMERGEPSGHLPGRVLRNYRTAYRADSRSAGR